jgi:aryl-alcohol dehydrogenase-like predicted oxidoreductase
MTALPRRTLGDTGIDVAVLGYGGMELYGPPRRPELSDAHVGRLLGEVLDLGIDLVDTSIDYGASEELIGRHLSHRRDEFTLATKCGCLVGWRPPEGYAGGEKGGGPHDFGRRNIVAGVEQSLQRLRTDYLDLVQVHASPSADTLREHEVVETLEDLRAQGKIRFIGMSGTLPDLPDHIAMGAFDVFQIPYSVIERQHEDVITDAAKAGAGVVVRGGAGRGTPSGEDTAVQRNPGMARAWERSDLDDVLGDMSPMEFTLRFTVSHPDMSTTIVGTANPEHLAANVEAVAKGPLPDDVYAEVKRRTGPQGQ